MAFRGDDQRRYGQVPPVQYPVSGQYSNQPQSTDGRSQMLIEDDDSAYHNNASAEHHHRGHPTGTADELFLSHPPAGSTQSTFPPPQSTANSMAGYPHRYQDPTPATATHNSYNPQSFAPPPNSNLAQGVGLPFTPHPSTRYPNTASNAQGGASPPPSAYNPQSYNPAAYAPSPSVGPQRQPTYHGYGGGYEQQAYSTHQQQSSSPYSPSPASTYSPVFSQPLHSPGLSAGYQQSLHSPASMTTNSTSQLPTPTYDPSQYATNQQYPTYQSHHDTAANTTNTYAATHHQTPYPAGTQIPVGPEYSSNDQSAQYGRPSRSDSHASSAASPYSPALPSPGLQRHPTNAPLPSRPLDGSGSHNRWGEDNRYGGANEYSNDNATLQESIMEEIEAELDVAGRRTTLVGGGGAALNDTPDRSPRDGSPSGNGRSYFNEDDDDPEGTAGVLAMRQAELDDVRFSSSTFAYVDMPAMPANFKDLPPPPEEQAVHNSEGNANFGGLDLAALSGGHAGNMMYEAYDQPTGSGSSQYIDSAQMPTPRYFNNLRESYHNAPAFNHAEMDYVGTGGLQPPTASRLSFDEGDEGLSIHSGNSGLESPSKEDYTSLFYHPGPTNRPLPAIPPGPGSDSSSLLSAQNSTRQPQRQHSHSLSADGRGHQEMPESLLYHHASNSYLQQPERSVSLSSHSNTPQVLAPARSRTDAAEERKKVVRHQPSHSHSGPIYSEYEAPTIATAPVTDFNAITLPTRKRKFIPSKLNASDYVRCAEPWALSSVESWLREMTQGEPYLREKTVEEALTVLFTYKVPTMNVADAEALGTSVFASMLKAAVLLPDEEWVKFGDGHISGVLWQLTGSGCYAPILHEYESGGRCYSFHCTRTLKKLDLEDVFHEIQKPTEWHAFYGLGKEEWESRGKKEMERQNILHEIATGEEAYIKSLDVFRTLYRDELRSRNPPIIHPDKRDRFLATVFGKLDQVLQINKDHLLAQLKYRQQEQGPWITGFSDLFREWIRKAKDVYMDYATTYPRAEYMMRKESRRNILFKKFLDDNQKHKLSMKKDWTHFLISPLQRLQRYILLLQSVESKMQGESEEKSILERAIHEIKVVTLDCDSKVAETNKRVEMMELDRKLVLRPGFQSVLNLDHLGRALIMQGDLQRLGNKGMRWVDTHALLFDHYLILAKVVPNKDGRGEEKYDVSREVRFFFQFPPLFVLLSFL